MLQQNVDLKSKPILITGAARRVGAAIARRLHGAGCNVVIHCNRSRTEADTLAQSMYKRKEKEQDLEKLKEIYEDIVASRECVSLKQLAVTGSDLIREAGIPEGPQVGVKLKELLSLVIEDPSRNTKEYLLSAAKQ